MTQQERLDIVRNKLDEGLKRLEAMDVEHPSFRGLVDSIMMINGLHWPIAHEYDPPTTTQYGDAPDPGQAVMPEFTEEPAEEPAPEPTPEPAPEPKEEAPALTKAEVIEKLTYLSNTYDVDVASVMKEMGYTKLSDMPATLYGELLEKANAKVA